MTVARDARQQFGDAVRALRREAGLTQEQLADKTGLHVTYIAGIETGRRIRAYGRFLLWLMGLR